MLLTFHVDDSRVAVWFTGVVDEPRGVSVHRGIYDVKVVNAEHVASDALVGRAEERVV